VQKKEKEGGECKFLCALRLKKSGQLISKKESGHFCVYQIGKYISFFGYCNYRKPISDGDGFENLRSWIWRKSESKYCPSEFISHN
jgi:hypothetical protein